MKNFLLVLFIYLLSNSFTFADNKIIKIYEEQFKQGLISEEEYNAVKENFENKNSKKQKKQKKELKLIKKEKSKKSKLFKKKEPIFDDDLALLEIYDKKKFEEEFKKYPNEIIEFFGKCSNNVSRAKKAGQYMSIEFNRSAKGQAKFPGRMIKAMAMYEFLYIDRLRDGKAALLRYLEKKNGKYLRKSADQKKIRGLISMNNGRKKMREALGMTLDTPRIEAAKKFWYLGEFLEMGTAVKNENYDKNLEKEKTS